jgi:predicted nicotinamide N-methyase
MNAESTPDATVEDVVVVAGRDLVIARPSDPEALLDERAFEHEEFLPYWAELWPSAIALARRIGVLALHGARVLELGCGLGLPSIAAALAGGRVLATDWAPDAIAFAVRNADANGARIETAIVSWGRPEELVARGPWDLVIGSDLLYERRNVPLVLDVLDRLLAPGASAIIADPRRAAAAEFVERAGASWSLRTTGDPGPPRVDLHELRRRS